MFWTERCNLFSIGDVLWRRKGGCLAFAHASRRTSSCICLSISTVFLFLLYLYFCDREKLSGPGLNMRETNHPLVLLCTGVTLMVSCTSCDHASFSPCTWIHVFLFFGTHQPQMADGPWREVGGCQEQWQPTHHSPALSALWFEGGAGMEGWGVVHWCWWPCTCTWRGAGALLHTLSKHAYGPRGCEKG